MKQALYIGLLISLTTYAAEAEQKLLADAVCKYPAITKQMHKIVADSHIQVLNALLNRTPENVEATDESGRTLLFQPASAGWESGVACLIKARADVSRTIPVCGISSKPEQMTTLQYVHHEFIFLTTGAKRKIVSSGARVAIDYAHQGGFFDPYIKDSAKSVKAFQLIAISRLLADRIVMIEEGNAQIQQSAAVALVAEKKEGS